MRWHRKGQNPATATEIQVRYEQMQKMMGATVGRIESELLKPLIDRVFGIMLRNNRFAQMPEELSGADLDVKYVGPLAKSQISADAVAIERSIEASMGISQITGRPSKVLDFDKSERILYDRYNTPAICVRSEKEVAKLEEQEKRKAAKAEAQQDAANNAQIEQQQVDADSANVELLQNMRGM